MNKGRNIAALSLIVALAIAVVTLGMASTTKAEDNFTPDFSTSYKQGPDEAGRGDVVTYTIVVANTGWPVESVTLTDTLPTGLDFARCTYEMQGSAVIPCEPPTLWKLGFDSGTLNLTSGTRVTTTLVATVTAGTTRFPLSNCATLGWDGGQEELCTTATVNPGPFTSFFPLVARNYPTPTVEPDYPYPLCPGEDVDAEGWGFTPNVEWANNEGDNDQQAGLPYYDPEEPLPIPYTCVGWIHAGEWYDSANDVPSSEWLDIDYQHYYISEGDIGRGVRVTLTQPKDYMIRWYRPSNPLAVAGYGWSNHYEPQRVVDIPATEVGYYSIKIQSNVIGEDGWHVPEYDPINYYTLTVEWK
jgi:uncharacterized repeat protein (TIGR01451 family)